MNADKKLEIAVGFLILSSLLALLFLALRASNLAGLNFEHHYTLIARFDNIGSLKVKAPVTIAGVEIGRVSAIEFDDDLFQAVVKMSIEQRYDRIPEDTYAKILTAGLLGEKYIGLDPGGSEDYLQDGSEIQITQSALVLEEIVSQFIFNMGKEH